MLDQLGTVETDLGRRVDRGEIEHRVESTRSRLRGHPSRDEHQLISWHRPPPLLMPPVHVLSAQIWNGVRIVTNQREAGLLSQLTQGRGAMVVILTGSGHHPSCQLGAVGVVDTPTGEYHEVSEESTGVATDHQDFERV